MSASNTIITPSVIAREVLYALLGNLVFKDLLFNAELSNEIVAAKAGDTINVKKPSKFKLKRYGGSLIKQNLNETSIPVVMDYLGDITVPISSKQMTLEINDFVSQVIRPIGEGMAIGIDSYIAAKMLQAIPAKNYVSATASPEDLADIGNLDLKLNQAKAPKQGRTLVLSPEHKNKYAVTTNLSAISYAGDSVTLREALLGRVYGFQTLESSYLPIGSGSSTLEVIGKITVSGEAGSKTVKVEEAVETNGKIKETAVLVVDGRVITIPAETGDQEATDGTIASLTVNQDDIEDMPNGVYKNVMVLTDAVSLAFSDVSFGFVNVPLEKPMNNPNSAIASFEGITVRVHYGYDQDKKEQILSVDTLFGFASFYPETSALLIGN